MIEKYRPLIILAAASIVLIGLWVIPAITHRGTVTGKERIPGARYNNADGSVRVTVDAYYITVEKHSGEQKTFRVSEQEYNINTVGGKYRKE